MAGTQLGSIHIRCQKHCELLLTLTEATEHASALSSMLAFDIAKMSRAAYEQIKRDLDATIEKARLTRIALDAHIAAHGC